jgi:MFS family permease
MAGPRAPIPPDRVDALRRRAVRTLVAGVALGSTGHIAAATIATIVAREISGSSALAGTPAAAVVFGAAVGATGLAWLMTRRGRRLGLAAGYAVGVIGALLAVGAVVAGSLALLLVGSLLLGFGNSSNLLSRYTAADLQPPERRASAIGIVVWGSTVGAVVGPNLVDPSGRFAVALGLPPLTGPYLVPIALVGLAAILTFVRLRPDPYQLANEPPAEHAASVAAPLAEVFRRPTVVAAVIALVVGQFVMVLIMTMTPLHMADHGHDLGAVGIVISAHTLGMFALAPISGRLTDRFGCTKVVYAGVALLAVSGVLAAAAPPDEQAGLLLALFLLGFGWNLGFVAGSAMLSGGVSLAERTRIQGLSDALIWSTSAIASLGSGVIVAAAGYAALGLLGAILVVVPAGVLWWRRADLGVRVEPPPFQPVAE